MKRTTNMALEGLVTAVKDSMARVSALKAGLEALRARKEDMTSKNF